MAFRVTNLKIQKMQGVDNTYYATWTFSDVHLKGYTLHWSYSTGDDQWFLDSNVTIDELHLNQATYSPPENAITIRLDVQPVSTTYDLNGVQTSWFIGEWVTAWFDVFRYSVPPMPSVPEVALDTYFMTVSVDNYDPGTIILPIYICFYVYKHSIDPDTGQAMTRAYYKSAIVETVNGTASFKFPVDPGSGYSVRARSMINQVYDPAHGSGYVGGSVYSEYTEWSDVYYTVPSTPQNLSAKAKSSTSVYLQWSPVNGADTYDVEYATSETYFDSGGNTTTVSEITTAYTEITGLETGDEYWFRVRAVNEEGESPWSSDIVMVSVGRPPNSPTTWSSSTTAKVGDTVNLYWVHNSADNSTETYAEVEITDNISTETHTIKNELADDDDNPDKDKTKFYALSTSLYTEGVKIKWRVRTAGVTKEYGDWSVMRTIDIYAPPTLAMSITDKDGGLIELLTSFPFYIRAFAGPNTQMPIGYHVTVTSTEGYETVDHLGRTQIVSAGQAIYDRHIDTNDPLLIEMTPSNIDLQNGVLYNVSVIVSMNSGLTTEEVMELPVSWEDEEYPLDARIGLNADDYTAYIIPYSHDTSGSPNEGLSLAVFRREFDGTFTEIASGVDSSTNTVVVDPHPALDYARYRIVGTVNATGAISYTDIPGQPFGKDVPVILQWDEAWSDFDATNTALRLEPVYTGSMLKLPYNIKVSENVNPEVSLVNYIGRSYPVSYYGTQINSTASWNIDIPKSDTDTLYQLRRLQIWTGDVYVREPSGTGYWANVGVSFNQSYDSLTVPITLDITRVEGGI